jgi:hypothetical protein
MRMISLRQRALIVLCAIVALTVATISDASAENPGFKYGNDSSQPTNTGSGPPYPANYCNGTCVVLGGYMGGFTRKIGGYGDLTGCTDRNDNTTDSARANANHADSEGFGTGGYYFLGGPGRDPAYNPSTYSNAAAYAWGEQQGQDAYTQWDEASDVFSPLIWADIEPGLGWEGWYYTCSATQRSSTHSAYFDGQVIDGFTAELAALGPTLKVGIYSDTDMWNSAFGCSSAAAALVTDRPPMNGLTVPDLSAVLVR